MYRRDVTSISMEILYFYSEWVNEWLLFIAK
jgi:hypothetical protein